MNYDLWVDFNDADEKGRISTLIGYATPGARIEPGEFVFVGDDEGNRCRAFVLAIDAPHVQLVLDAETFEAGDEDSAEMVPAGG